MIYDPSETILTTESDVIFPYIMTGLEPCSGYTGVIYLLSILNEIEIIKNFTFSKSVATILCNVTTPCSNI